MNDCILLLCCLFCLGGCGCNNRRSSSCGCQNRSDNSGRSQSGCANSSNRPQSGGCGSNSGREESCPCKEPRFEPRFEAMPFNGSGSTCGCEEKS